MECNSEALLWESLSNLMTLSCIVPYVDRFVSRASDNELFAYIDIKSSNFSLVEGADDIFKLDLPSA